MRHGNGVYVFSSGKVSSIVRYCTTSNDESLTADQLQQKKAK